MKANRIRVAMLIWSYWPGHEGGAERQCRKIIPYLAEKNVDITVCTAWTQWGHLRRQKQVDGEIVRLGWFVPLLMAMRRFLDRLLARTFRGTTAKARRWARIREALSFWLSLPLTMAARISFLLDLWLWFRRTNKRPDVIHVHESSWMAGAAAFLARRYGIPVFALTAVFPAWDVLGYDVPLRGTFSRARRACWFHSLAPYLTEDLLAKGVLRDRIFLVPNGVEIPECTGDRPASKEVLFVANFSQGVEQKAFDVMIQAWAVVVKEEPAARLLLLGDGDRTQWEDMVKKLHLESSAHFVGWTPTPEEYYRRAALFALPSRSEGMSNALLEAQSWGLPCVVSDIPGNLAVVANGENGLVVPVGDAQALAQAILRLMADDALRSVTSQEARERMIKYYSLNSVSERLCNIYRQLAECSLRGES